MTDLPEFKDYRDADSRLRQFRGMEQWQSRMDDAAAAYIALCDAARTAGLRRPCPRDPSHAFERNGRGCRCWT